MSRLLCMREDIGSSPVGSTSNMRIEVEPEPLLAAAAVPAMVEDHRADDHRRRRAHPTRKALSICAEDSSCAAASIPRARDWPNNGSEQGTANVNIPPSWYRVAVSATLGSMNGCAIAAGGEEAWHALDDEAVLGPDPGYGWPVRLRRSDGARIEGLTDESGWYDADVGRRSR